MVLTGRNRKVHGKHGTTALLHNMKSEDNDGIKGAQRCLQEHIVPPVVFAY